MASREQLSADLQESREENEELRTQIDQLQEDGAQEMEDLEQQLKDQYAGEMTTKDETIAALEAQLAEQNLSWETSYNELQEQKTAMETDYESKLATWTKSREQGREVWTNPITGETASTDMTWKNPREQKMEAEMKKMKEKLDRNNAESRKGSSKVQVVQTELNDLRKQLKVEQNAHEALRRRHYEDNTASWDEIDKLENIVMVLSEELSNAKLEKEEKLTRLHAVIMASRAKILRTQLEAEDATREMKKGMKSARLVQVALERQIQRLIRSQSQLGLSLAESETRAANAEAIKQKEFDILRVKLSKAHEVHQDDSEALARLWPDDNGYTLPTVLQPYADVIRIERERKQEEQTLKDKNAKIDFRKLKNRGNGRQVHHRGVDDIDTDSDDEAGTKHREDLERELAAMREEMLYPSLRQIDQMELLNPKFKVISTTPRRRKFALYDTPRVFIDKVPNILDVMNNGEGKEGKNNHNNVGPHFGDADGESEEEGEGDRSVVGESGEMVNPPDNILDETLDGELSMNDAVKAALKLRLQIPSHVMKYTPSTAIGGVATQMSGFNGGGRGGGRGVAAFSEFAGDPWDSDNDSYIPSNHVTPRDPNEVHQASDEKIEEKGDTKDNGVLVTQKYRSTAVDGPKSLEEKKEEEDKKLKKIQEGQKTKEQKEADQKEAKEQKKTTEQRNKNPITGQPMNHHSGGTPLGPIAPIAVGTMPMQPPNEQQQQQQQQQRDGQHLAMSSTFLAQAGIDPNNPSNHLYTPRSMTRLYAKAGIAQIKRLMKAGLRPLGDAHLDGGNKKKEGEEGDEGEEGEGGEDEGEEGEEGEKGEEGAMESGEEGEGEENDEDDEEDEDKSGSDSEDGVSSDESDSDESDVSSVDIDAELGLATDGTAAKLAAEAAAKKKAKETWTSEERAAFEFALIDLAEYDEDRKWVKIQKRVGTRTLKECKKFMKVLQSEEKSRNRELKSLVKEMKEQVVLMQTPKDQIFDCLFTTVQQVEVVDMCRMIFVNCIYTAVLTAPSVVRLERERGRVRREEEMLRKTPWLSLKTKTKQSIPKVLARAIRSMLRNGLLTKPRAFKLVEMYRRAPTLEEEEDTPVSRLGVSGGATSGGASGVASGGAISGVATSVVATSGVATSGAASGVPPPPLDQGGLTTRSVNSMVGQAITLAETDEPFADLELEETSKGQRDTQGRLTSKLSLRRHEAMLQREHMHREREFTVLSARQRYIQHQATKEEQKVMMVVAHLESQTYVRDDKQKVCDDWSLVIDKEEMAMDADVALKRTWCVPMALAWTPPLTDTVTKERLVLGSDGLPEKGEDGATPTGNTETYTEEVTISEAQSLVIQAQLVKDKILAVKQPVEEGEGEAKVHALDEHGQPKYVSVHSEPLNIVFQKWKKHPYDIKGGPVPKWSCHIEMNDATAMEGIVSLFPMAEGSGIGGGIGGGIGSGMAPQQESFVLHCTPGTTYRRRSQQQEMRRARLERMCDVVRAENVKVHLLELSQQNAVAVQHVRQNHYKDINEELKMFHRRCGAVNRMETVHRQLLTWISHRANRSMQTKDELLLLAKNAQHKVRKAQEDLDQAQNPLASAFCEQRLNEKLLEADKVLRYVRKRFHAELNVRRQLAKERREALLQQCARLSLVSKLSLERMRVLRSVRRSQEHEMVHVQHKARAVMRQEEHYQGDGRNVESTVGQVLDDLVTALLAKNMQASGKHTVVEIARAVAKENPGVGRRDAWSREQQGHVVAYELAREATTARSTVREREHATILDEIEKLEGVAGEWLSNNQVQQAEDQLALARSVLDDQKKMMALFKEEARVDVEELKEQMIVNTITGNANVKKLQNEITSRRRAAGLAIAHMQHVAMQARDALEHLRKEKDAEIMRMAESHALQMSELNARLEELELLADRRGKWVNSLQVQIKLMRVEMVDFQAKYKREHEGWERERNGFVQQLKYETTQSERRLAWIESLKVEVDVQKKEQARLVVATEARLEKSKDQQQDLKWQVWQRDETARRIRMDADSCFKWFLESIANLCGASKKHNDRMYYNGAVGILNAVISKDCLRGDLKPLAARALGALAWNGFVDHRVISRRR